MDTAKRLMRFGYKHVEIVRKLVASGKYPNRSKMFSVASKAFKRAKLPSIAYSTFTKHLRTTMNRNKGAPYEYRYLSSHIYTPQHTEILEEVVLAHPYCQRDRLFDLINERFKNLGIRPITDGTFRSRVSDIRKAFYLPDSRKRSCVS